MQYHMQKFDPANYSWYRFENQAGERYTFDTPLEALECCTSWNDSIPEHRRDSAGYRIVDDHGDVIEYGVRQLKGGE